MANPGANADIRFGLKPIKSQRGAPWNGAGNLYYIPSTYETDVFIGDPVVRASTANTATVITGAGEYAAGTLPDITVATLADGNLCTGAVVGFLPDADDLAKVYGAADTERVAIVSDDPELVYHIRDDGVAALAVTNVGNNAIMIATHAGSTDTGISGYELDTNGTAPGNDASYMLTIGRLAAIEGNTVAARAIWEVRINQHSEAGGALGL